MRESSADVLVDRRLGVGTVRAGESGGIFSPGDTFVESAQGLTVLLRAKLCPCRQS